MYEKSFMRAGNGIGGIPNRFANIGQIKFTPKPECYACLECMSTTGLAKPSDIGAFLEAAKKKDHRSS
jgi:hypothetical protein